MIAICTKCGLTFPFRLIAATDSTITLSNVGTTCPGCGGSSIVLNGEYQFDKDGIITLLSGPEFTKDVITRFYELTKLTRNKKISTEEYIDKAYEIHPTAGRIAKSLTFSKSDWIAIITFLLGILYQMATSEPKVVINNYTNLEQKKTDTVVIKDKAVDTAIKGSNYTPPKKRRKKKS